MNNLYERQILKALGWNYIGVCSCSEPADEFTKGELKLKISRRRDRWNLLNKNKVVLRFGDKNTLIDQLNEYEASI